MSRFIGPELETNWFLSEALAEAIDGRFEHWP